FRHVRYLWDDAKANLLDPLGRLVYRSNILGADLRITNTGGGNTSSKLSEKDPLSGKSVDVLWVKGSGGDLRTSGKENFASLYMDKLVGLIPRYREAPGRGPKTPAEDALVGMYSHCTYNLNPRASSIDTPPHAFIPARYIESNDKGDKTFGGRKYADVSDTKRRELQIKLLPWLRGQLSRQKRMIGTVQDDAAILRFVNSADAPRLAELGTSCPDHFLRTKIKPLYVDWDPHSEDVPQLRAKLDAGLVAYREDYGAYYERCKHADSPPMRDANPTVILIP